MAESGNDGPSGSCASNPGIPPDLSFKLPKLSGLVSLLTPWNEVELPVDALLLTVKDVELLSCYAYLKNPVKSYHKGLGYVYFGTMGADQLAKVKVALVRCRENFAGPSGALTVVKNAADTLRPKVVFSVGSCASLGQEKAQLGDVVLSAKVTTYSHKEVRVGQVHSCGVSTPCSRDIADIIRYTADGWKAPLENPEAREITVHCKGEFWSGPELVDAPWRREELCKQYPKAIAIEMEGEGVFSAAYDLKMEWIVVKGVSNYADGTKTDTAPWKPFACTMAASVVSHILKDPIVFEDWAHYKESIPVSILERGEKDKAAYRRAVKFGWTLDKRVKVLLVGQDRVGKTSVGRTLRGEKFDEYEPSTEGVLMNKPLKNVGQQAWQNSELHKDTSAYDHKCAELVIDLTRSRDQSVEGPNEESTAEPTNKSKSEQNKQPTQEPHYGPNMQTPPMDKETGTAESNLSTAEHVSEQEDDMPDQVARLVENGRQEDKTESGDGIWPVIWDFAGQAVYRAIHPIFLSPETVYILVFDLRKKLSDKAQCCVKRDGCDEKEVKTSDYNDTNFDHIMRWMDLIHSLKTVPKDLPHVASPPVIIVGTHADSKDVNHKEKMNILMEKFRNTEEFEKHIVDTFVVDNTRAGQPKDQEDPAAKDLRDLILREASKMPYTQNKVPLQWLAVEKKISEIASHDPGSKYVAKKEFKEKFTNGICSFENENDIEALLHFLHDRGSILYHDRADNSDGLVVLDPQWLIKKLCEILKVEPEDGDRATIKRYRENLETEGILAEGLLLHACTKACLVGIKGYLLYLMKKFNLICNYKIKEEEVYLVPCMVTARPDEQTTSKTSTVLPPLYLSFKTKYVPCGLFPRLVLLFAEWATLKCCIQPPRLFANAANFSVGKVHCLRFSCYKSVIEFFIWTRDDSDPLEKEPQCCLEVLRFLEKSLDKLCEECHWLHYRSWDLCVQCNLCREIPDAKSGDCCWHDKKECAHPDCAHYVKIPQNSEPLCCYRLDNMLGTLFPDREKFDPWIEAFTKLRDAKHKEKPETKNSSSTCNSTQTPKRRRLATSPRQETNSGHEVQPNSATESLQVKEGTPSNEELEELAREIVDSWITLGRRLKIKEAALTGFHKQHEEYSEKAYRMLLAWKRENCPDASYQVLYDALCHCLVSRADLATTFCCVKRL